MSWLSKQLKYFKWKYNFDAVKNGMRNKALAKPGQGIFEQIQYSKDVSKTLSDLHVDAAKRLSMEDLNEMLKLLNSYKIDENEKISYFIF